MGEDPDTGVSFDRRTGFVGGIFFEVDFIGGVELQPEVLYVRRGAKLVVDPELAPLAMESELQMDALEVPLLIKISAANTLARAVPHLLFGPAASFLLQAKQRSGQDEAAVEVDVADQFKEFDVALVVGVGMVIDRLTLEARYSFGVDEHQRQRSRTGDQESGVAVNGGLEVLTGR